MTVVVRFAPSPTGRLHVGNARTALINWLFAHRAGGRFLLRFDDTDQERSQEGFVAEIEDDLRWLGLDWDNRVRQSARVGVYAEAAAQLRRDGFLYPCYETPEELEFKRRRQRARGQPPVYDRAALRLTAAERTALEAEGRTPHWRLKLPEGEVVWDDLVRGTVRIRTQTLSDPILIRADGTFLYMLPSTVDDVDFGVTHVIRGEDHVTNTAVQIALSRALRATAPCYGHVPLLTDKGGQSLSKRLGGLTLDSLRARGIEAMALACFLARLGTGAPLQPCYALSDLAADFDLSRLARAPAKFDEDQLLRLNEMYLHGLPFELVQPRLAAMGLGRATEAFWLAIRQNIRTLGEVREWYQVCFGEIVPVIADKELADCAAAMLPPEPWTTTTWGEWTTVLQQRTGRHGRRLFQPLRLALTGTDHGPELKQLLPLIGRETAEHRLRS